MVRAFLFGLVIWVWALPSFAQDPIDFQAFNTFASSAEASIESDALSDADFEQLRATLVEWRAKMLEGQGANAVQIDAIEAQINALATEPSDGDASGLEARKSALQEDLETAREPQLSAVEGFARADALIGLIDDELRSRQADALLSLGRSPLDPSLWQPALASLARVYGDAQSEMLASLAGDSRETGLAQRLALAALFLGIAFFLLLRGNALIGALLDRIARTAGPNAVVVYGFLVSGGGVVVALVGISLINAALISTGFLGTTGRSIAIGVNTGILAFAGGRWLGGRTFPERSVIPSALHLSDGHKAIGRRSASNLGIFTGFLSLQTVVDQTITFDSNTIRVLTFPIFALMGYALFRLGGLIKRGAVEEDDEGIQRYGGQLVRFVGFAVQALAILAPILAAIGFYDLARGLLWPTALSLALVAFLHALHFVLRAGYAMFLGLDAEKAKDALIPVLASITCVLASFPFFALFWGARDSDLGEVWTAFRTGAKIGDVTLSPGSVLTLLVVFAVGYGLTRLVQGTLRSSVLPRTQLDKGGQNAITSGVGYVGVTLAALVAITAAGLNLSSFAIVIGALGVGIGFGLQNIVNNFVSGIILLIERPVGEGDWVEVNGHMGIVKAISVRSTRIETFDRTDVIVPNGDLISGTVTNWTRGNSVGRIIVPVGVAYGTDTRKIEQILTEIAMANPIVAVSPAPYAMFKGFGADSLDFEIRAILTDINFGLTVRSEINHEIARRFEEEGIEIPFAQRDIWLRNPEALVSS